MMEKNYLLVVVVVTVTVAVTVTLVVVDVVFGWYFSILAELSSTSLITSSI